MSLLTLHARHPVVHFTMSVKHGSEGPDHDPYAYMEHFIDFSRHYKDGTSTGHLTLHAGLGEWVKIETECHSRPNHFSYREETIRERVQLDMDGFDNLVEFYTGYTLTQMRRIYRKLEEAHRRGHRGHGQPEWQQGFPGESMLLCPCGAVLDSTFNESAII